MAPNAELMGRPLVETEMTPILKTLREVREELDRSAERMLFAEPWLAAEKDIDAAEEAITSLTTLIAEIEKAEPVAWVIRTDNTNLHELDPNKTCSWLDFDVEQFKHNAARSLKIVDAAPLYTHPAPAITEGWQLVPKEPTPEMKEAYRLATIQFDTLTHSAYRAMLAAAPEPKP